MRELSLLFTALDAESVDRIDNSEPVLSLLSRQITSGYLNHCTSLLAWVVARKDIHPTCRINERTT